MPKVGTLLFRWRSFWPSTVLHSGPERPLAKLPLQDCYRTVPTSDLPNITGNFSPEALSQFFLHHCLKPSKRNCMSERVLVITKNRIIFLSLVFFVAASVIP